MARGYVVWLNVPQWDQTQKGMASHSRMGISQSLSTGEAMASVLLGNRTCRRTKLFYQEDMIDVLWKTDAWYYLTQFTAIAQSQGRRLWLRRRYLRVLFGPGGEIQLIDGDLSWATFGTKKMNLIAWTSVRRFFFVRNKTIFRSPTSQQ